MSNEENRARAADLRRRGAFLCGKGTPTEADLDAVETFAAFLADRRPVRGTFAHAAWVARWGPYIRGEADGPTEPTEQTGDPTS